jgi:hypothetical protein
MSLRELFDNIVTKLTGRRRRRIRRYILLR